MWWALAIWIITGPGIRQISEGVNDLHRYLESKAKDNENDK